mmetsp:Transcript_59700/g.142044  ORF Transcript_59700/g.142044 Transcript_59700/m.142044 type:complete len:240 (-) Transcript_59700:595-1314(-)
MFAASVSLSSRNWHHHLTRDSQMLDFLCLCSQIGHRLLLRLAFPLCLPSLHLHLYCCRHPASFLILQWQGCCSSSWLALRQHVGLEGPQSSFEMNDRISHQNHRRSSAHWICLHLHSASARLSSHSGLQSSRHPSPRCLQPGLQCRPGPGGPHCPPLRYSVLWRQLSRSRRLISSLLPNHFAQSHSRAHLSSRKTQRLRRVRQQLGQPLRRLTGPYHHPPKAALVHLSPLLPSGRHHQI